MIDNIPMIKLQCIAKAKVADSVKAFISCFKLFSSTLSRVA